MVPTTGRRRRRRTAPHRLHAGSRRACGRPSRLAHGTRRPALGTPPTRVMVQFVRDRRREQRSRPASAPLASATRQRPFVHANQGARAIVLGDAAWPGPFAQVGDLDPQARRSVARAARSRRRSLPRRPDRAARSAADVDSPAARAAGRRHRGRRAGRLPQRHDGRRQPGGRERLVRRRYAAPGYEQAFAVRGTRTAVWISYDAPAGSRLGRRAAARRVVDVDRIGAARDGVGEEPPRKHVLARQRVLARRCGATRGCRSGSPSPRCRALAKPGTSLPEEREQFGHLAAASTSARVRSSGSSGSMPTTRVMFTVTSSGYGVSEERDEFARNVDVAASSAPRPPEVVEPGDRRQRPARRARPAAGSRPHLIGVRAGRRRHVLGQVDVAQPEHEAGRLHAPAFVALLRRSRRPTPRRRRRPWRLW